MNYGETVREVARRTGTPQEQVKVVVDALLDVITETLGSGGTVRMRNFGTLKPSHYRGRSFETGEVQAPAPSGVVFKASDALKAVVRRGPR